MFDSIYESSRKGLDANETWEFLNTILIPHESDKKILVIPPDFTRFHSGAGMLTQQIWQLMGQRIKAVLPALGTHFPMTDQECRSMFPSLPRRLVKDHLYRTDAVELGRVQAGEIRKLSSGLLDFDWPVQVNRLLVEEDWDLVISIGQVVPHEIAGMANYTKNILVGTGGKEGIDKSHFLGAVCGMENIMGRVDSPVRTLFSLGNEAFCRHLPILYLLTVVSPDHKGFPRIRGLFAGDDEHCFQGAAALSGRENLTLLDFPVDKMVVYLNPGEYKSCWLGNKGIYRTRMAMADRGELIILAPGVRCFGENDSMDSIIRQHGYRGRDYILDAVKTNKDLADNLAVAAHLIHGSTEGRFQVRYCPGGLSVKEVEQAGYSYGQVDEYLKRYNPCALKEGWNVMEDGEKIYYIPHPSLGLWALKEKFTQSH